MAPKATAGEKEANDEITESGEEIGTGKRRKKEKMRGEENGRVGQKNKQRCFSPRGGRFRENVAISAFGYRTIVHSHII